MRYVYLVLIAGFTIGYADTKYSVNDLVSMTIETHPNIKMQEQIIRGANAQLQGAMWSYFPTPAISFNQGTDKNKLWGAKAIIDQPLWTGGKLSSAYDMALANKHNSEYGLEDSGYTLVEALLNAIKTYLKAQGDLEALSEGQMQLGILEGMVSRRIAAGVSSRSDMELLKARLYQMETDINYAKTRRATSLSQIELLTNQKFDGGLQIDDTILFSFDSVENIIKAMTNSHPSLKKLDAQLEYAEAEKSKAKSVFWPNISIRAQRDMGSSSLNNNDPINDTIVYLSVQASPGAGLSAFSGVESAEAKIMQIRAEKLSKQQDLVNKVMFAYNDYTSSTNRVEYQSGSVGSSQKVFASYTRLFLAGKRQWLDLVNASRELTQNEMAFADTKSTLLVSAYQLALLEGKGGLLKMISGGKLAKAKKPVRSEIPIIPSSPFIPANQKQEVTFDTIFPRKDENSTKAVVTTAAIVDQPKKISAPIIANNTTKTVTPPPVELPVVVVNNTKAEKTEGKVIAGNKKQEITFDTIFPRKDGDLTKTLVATTAIVDQPKKITALTSVKSPMVVASSTKVEKPAAKVIIESKKVETKAKVAALGPKVETKEKNETRGWQGFIGLFGKKAETKVAAAPAVQAPVVASKKAETKAEKPKAIVAVVNPKVETKEKNETRGWQGFKGLFGKRAETKVAAALAVQVPVVASKKAETKAAVVASAKAEKPKAIVSVVSLKVKKPKTKIVIENRVVGTKAKALAPTPEVQTPVGTIVKTTKPILGKAQYYVQFNAKLDESMKNELKKQNLEIIENGDHCLIGCYARPTDALKVAREVKKIICDEAYIVRQ